MKMKMIIKIRETTDIPHVGGKVLEEVSAPIKRGESIEFDTKPEWAGKNIEIMLV